MALTIAGLLVSCGGIVDEDNPLLGFYYMESITLKLALDKMLLVEAPNLDGELTVDDTSYNMYYGLLTATGDTAVDNLLIDRHYIGRYEFIGSDRESLRLYGMPKIEPYYTDWWYHRTAGTLRMDNPYQTQVWTWRNY